MLLFSGFLADTPWAAAVPSVGGRLAALFLRLGLVFRREHDMKAAVVDHYALWSQSQSEVYASASEQNAQSQRPK